MPVIATVLATSRSTSEKDSGTTATRAKISQAGTRCPRIARDVWSRSTARLGIRTSQGPRPDAASHRVYRRAPLLRLMGVKWTARKTRPGVSAGSFQQRIDRRQLQMEAALGEMLEHDGGELAGELALGRQPQFQHEGQFAPAPQPDPAAIRRSRRARADRRRCRACAGFCRRSTSWAESSSRSGSEARASARVAGRTKTNALPNGRAFR